MGAKGLKKSLEETLSDGVMNEDYDGKGILRNGFLESVGL